MSKQLTKLNDSNVESTLAQIQIKKAEYRAALKKFEPKTNMNLELFGQRYNLHVSDINQLKFLRAFLAGFGDVDVEVCGYKLRTWFEDICHRIENLETKAALHKLEQTEDKLTTMYTPDKKNELEFNDILHALENL